MEVVVITKEQIKIIGVVIKVIIIIKIRVRFEKQLDFQMAIIIIIIIVVIMDTINYMKIVCFRLFQSMLTNPLEFQFISLQ